MLSFFGVAIRVGFEVIEVLESARDHQVVLLRKG